MATGSEKSRARRSRSKTSRSSGSSSSSRSSSSSSSPSPFERAKALGYGGGSGSRQSDNETVAQTFARGKGFLEGRTDTRGRAITPEGLENTPVAEMPQRVAPVTPGLDLNQANAGLGAGSDGMFQIPTIAGQAGDSEGVTAAIDASNAIGTSLQQAMALARPEEGASENALADSRRQAGVDSAQREFNRFSNQINSITARRDAAQLGLEGQGRGITETIIGGQQARIGREAAIQALPIQAQLAAAQGNLEQAQQLMGQLFSAKSADIQADQSYRTNLANSVMSFATTSQQNILQAKQADIAQRAQTAQSNLNFQRQLGMQALEFGQNGLISGISAIDPSSATFEADMASFTSQLRKPVAAGASAKPQNIGTAADPIWATFDASTNSFVPVGGAGGGDGSSDDISSPGGELDKIALIRDSIARIKGQDANEETGQVKYKPLYKASDQTPTSEFFGRTFTGNSDLDNLKVYAKTLSSNMLVLATDPEIKKFYGPQMSEADVRGMEATATRLDVGNMTAEQTLSEINRLETFVGKYEGAVKAKQSGTSVNFGIPGAFTAVGGDGVDYIVVPDDYTSTTANRN